MEIWTVFLATAVILLCYYYFKNKKNHFDEHGIPYKNPLPIFGNVAPAVFQQRTFNDCIGDAYNLNKDAKYVGFFDFSSPVIVIRDLELSKAITSKYFYNFVNHRPVVDPSREPLMGNHLLLLKDNKWREVRSVLSPSFTSSKMKAMFKLMTECATNYTNYFTEMSKEQPLVTNAKDSFTRYTNDVIATCAFGIKIDSLRDPNNEFYVLGRRATSFEGLVSIKFFLFRRFPRLAKLLNLKLLDSKLDSFFTELVRSTMSKRDAEGISRPDMLQLMMDSRKNEKGRKLSFQEMTSQAFVFFAGGFDSTATMLSFVTHEIAANPKIQEKFQKEVDDVFNKCDGHLTYEAVQDMVYLEALLNEVMRRHSIISCLDRVCNKPFELPPTLPGSKPYVVQPGDDVWISMKDVQLDPKYYDHPEVFDPERFIKDGKLTIDSSLPLLPFGQGPRMCIGNRFALLGTKILLIHLFSKCSLKVAKKMKLPLTMSTKSFVDMAEGGFWLEIDRRRNNFSSP